MFCRSQSIQCVLNAGSGETYPTHRPRHLSVNGPDNEIIQVTTRASWLRVRTRVATVTRLEATDSNPIDGRPPALPSDPVIQNRG